MSAAYGNPYPAYAPAQTEPRAVKAGPLVGLLNGEGTLDWPLALRILPPGPETRDLRRQIDARAAEVQRQATAGPVDPGLLKEMSRDVDRLREMLADKADRLSLPEQSKTDARQFLRKLRDALKTDQ
jgi:hypothetical protein